MVKHVRGIGVGRKLSWLTDDSPVLENGDKVIHEMKFFLVVFVCLPFGAPMPILNDESHSG